MKFFSIMLLPLVSPHCIYFLSVASFSLVNLFTFPRSPFLLAAALTSVKHKAHLLSTLACVPFDLVTIPLLSQK